MFTCYSIQTQMFPGPGSFEKFLENISLAWTEFIDCRCFSGNVLEFKAIEKSPVFEMENQQQFERTSTTGS